PGATDGIATGAVLLLFGATMGGFDLRQRVARRLGPRAHEVMVSAMQFCLVWALKLIGMRIEVERGGELVPGRPYVLVANHQSMFDMPIVNRFLFRHCLKYVAKRELTYGYPGVSYYLRHGGHAIIDRKNRAQALEAIRELGRTIERRGIAANIYPEGTRARDGQLRAFKIAGPLQLLDAAPSAEVVPVAIDGPWQLLRYNLRPVPFGTRVRLRIGAPLPRRAGEDRVALVRQAEAEIRSTIARWRRQVPVPAAAGEAQA